MTMTVRINPTTHSKLKQLAEQFGESMPTILERAVEAYRRQKFLEEANRAYAVLRSNSEAWSDEREERETWDATLSDDLVPGEFEDE